MTQQAKKSMTEEQRKEAGSAGILVLFGLVLLALGFAAYRVPELRLAVVFYVIGVGTGYMMHKLISRSAVTR